MNLQALPEEALKEILALTEAKKKLDLREKAQEKFMAFAHHVYDNFIDKKKQNFNEKLCKVRAVFEQYNLISGLHTFFSQNDPDFKNILPPLRILNEKEKSNLLNKLDTLNFKYN